jgi:hypothetical protein
LDTLFDPDPRETLVGRVKALRPDAQRQWGKMDPAQALAHCALALEAATGDHPSKQKLLGKILAPLVRKKVLGPEPFGKDSPTDARLRVSDPRDLDRERERLLALVAKFAAGGPAAAGRWEHVFFGKLSGDEWGLLMHKHIDHHLRQFGA